MESRRLRAARSDGTYLLSSECCLVTRLPFSGVGVEFFEGDEFEGVEVGSFENDGRSFAGLEGFDPAGDAEAPVVAGF